MESSEVTQEQKLEIIVNFAQASQNIFNTASTNSCNILKVVFVNWKTK